MAIGSLIGAVIGANASQNAASTAAAASDRASQLSADAAAKMREDLLPFRAVGTAAAGRLARMFGLLDQSPIAYTPPAQAQQPTGGPAGPGGLVDGYRYVAGEGPSETFPGGSPSAIIDANGNTVALNPDPATIARYMAPAQSQQSSIAQTQQPAPAQSFPDGETGPFQAQTEFQMTPEALAATPGHQFALSEGMKAINNSLAARGGLFSGRALKEASRFATGLADNTLRTQAGIFGENYGRAQNKFATNLSPLLQLMQSGQNAAAQTGAGGLSAAQAGGAALSQGGAYSAAGQIAGGNALMSGVNSGVNNALYAWGRGWLGGGGGGNTGAAATNAMNSYDWIPY